MRVFVVSADGLTGHSLALRLVSEKFSVSAGLVDKQHEEDLKRRGVNVIHYKPDDEQDFRKYVQKHDLVCIIPPHRVENPFGCAEMMLRVCNELKTPNVILFSTIDPEHAENEQVIRQFHQLEEKFKQCHNIKCRIVLRTGMYNERFLLYRDNIVNENVLPLATGQGKFAPISVHCISHFVTTLLTKHKTEEHHGKCYSLTGSELVNGDEVARRASQALGMQLKFKDISREEARHLLEQHQLDETELELFLALFEMARNSKLELVSKDYEKIVGEKPMTVEQWFKERRDKFRK